MLPIAYVSHHGYGRTRIRIPSKRGDKAYFGLLTKKVGERPGIERLETNASTASLLLHHQVDLETISAYGEQGKVFDLREKETRPRAPIVETAAKGVEETSRGLRQMTSGAVDLRTLAFVGLVGLAFYQGARGKLLAPASTLLSDALKLLPFG